MPVLAIFTGPGTTKDMYESLRREVDWERQHPAGGLLHLASFDEQGGIHVVDMWESGELMDKFVSERLMPAMQKLDIPAPDVAVYPVHNANLYPVADQYKL